MTELTEYSLLWITFIGAPWVLKVDGHVRIDVFLVQLNRKSQNIVKGLLSVVCSIILIPIIWYGASYTIDCFIKGSYVYSVLELPKGAIMIVIPIGCFLLFIQFVRLSFTSFRGK